MSKELEELPDSNEITRHPTISGPMPGRIFLIPKMQPDGWIFDRCVLCHKWVTRSHLKSKKHLERVADADQYIPDGWPRQIFPRMPSVATWMQPRVKLRTPLLNGVPSASAQAEQPSMLLVPLDEPSVSVPATSVGEHLDPSHEEPHAV